MVISGRRLPVGAFTLAERVADDRTSVTRGNCVKAFSRRPRTKYPLEQINAAITESEPVAHGGKVLPHPGDRRPSHYTTHLAGTQHISVGVDSYDF